MAHRSASRLSASGLVAGYRHQLQLFIGPREARSPVDAARWARMASSTFAGTAPTGAALPRARFALRGLLVYQRYQPAAAIAPKQQSNKQYNARHRTIKEGTDTAYRPHG